MDIVQEAKNKIYSSDIMNYVSKEKIEQAFSNVIVFNSEEEFYKEYGRSSYGSDGILEGFNRAKGSFLNPTYATPHTVIHEVLHAISSKFDEQGHRIQSGIEGSENLRFANMVNEGATDYIAAKISGESPRHYIKGHLLFAGLEPMLIKFTKNNEMLEKMYLTNDVQFLQKFLDQFGGDKGFKYIYENFSFMDKEKISIFLDGTEKKFNRYMKKQERKEKIRNLFSKIKNIFSKKQEIKQIPQSKQNSNADFVNKYKVEPNQMNIGTEKYGNNIKTQEENKEEER